MADIYLISYLVYKIISEATKYSEWQNYGCKKPFAPFLILHWLSFIFYRLFHYLEIHCRYRDFRAALSESGKRECNAHVSVKMMQRFKFFSCTSFVIMAFLASLWYVHEQSCPRHLMSRLELWIMMSWVICLFYLIMAILGQKTLPISVLDIEMPSPSRGRDIHLNRVQYEIIGSGQRDRNKGLTKAKIRLIKKQTMNQFDDLEQNVMWFDSESSEEFWTVCSVCLEDMTVNDWYKQLPKCGHYFHSECIDQWLTVSALCPVCRETVGEENGARRSPSCSFRTPRITLMSPRRSFENWMSINGGLTEKILINGGLSEKKSINGGSMGNLHSFV